MKNKLSIYIILALSVGVLGGYMFSRQRQMASLQQANNQLGYGYGNGIGQGQNMQLNRENCLADDCLLVEDVEYPVGDLPSEVTTALHEAINDEYKALSVYEAVIAKFGATRPFSMIKGAEEQHIASLKAIYDKYGLEVPINTWPSKVTTPATLQAACQTGVDAEIANAALYREKLLPVVTEYEDISLVFQNLMTASEQKHLPAFERCN